MRCISPISVPDPRGTSKAVRMTVPCGKCLNCYSNRRDDWTLRLSNELKVADSAIFVTLTYNDEHLSDSLDKTHIQAFMKRLRYKVEVFYSEQEERLSKELKRPKIKYFIVGEYGPKTKRPHYHGILFNLPENADNYIIKSWVIGSGKYEMTEENTPVEVMEELGFVHFGTVTQASIHYTTKYVVDALMTIGNFSNLKDSEGKFKVQKPFNMCSKGIGIDYVTSSKAYHRNSKIDYYNHPGNIKQRLPRYYKEKFFSEREREAFAEEAEAYSNEQEVERRKEEAIKGLPSNYVYQEYESKKMNYIKKMKKRLI